MKRSLRTLTDAANRGDVEAQYQLAAFLGSGDGCNKDLAAAARWYGKAAAKKHPEALYNLGLMHLLGEVGRPAAKKGISQIEQAAELGSWDAHWFLAQVFMDGLHGQTRDMDKAAYYSVLSLGGRYANATRALAHRLQAPKGIKTDTLARALLRVADRMAQAPGKSRPKKVRKSKRSSQDRS